MVGQAKALALYDRPVWRETGLSGSAFSRVGPLGELHDASLPGAAGIDRPPTRALRPSVILHKVTNGLRSNWGAETYAALRSLVSTAKANRRSVLDDLRQALATASSCERKLQPGRPITLAEGGPGIASRKFR